MEVYVPGIGISAGSMMLKWQIMNDHIHNTRLKLNNEDINIFINFESILRNLTFQRNLNDLISFYKQKVVIELEAAILNMVANYKMYFKKENCNPKIYLYYTDLNKDKQQMSIYNRYYRNFYFNKYNNNPDYKSIGKILNSIIIPELELIMSYIPDCYFIKATGFDGSIIPLVISSLNSNKNVIISSDIFDTLYLFNPNFINIYIKRRYSNLSVLSNIETIVQSIIKDEQELNIFNTELYYKLLLSIKGSKIRNITSTKGFGYGKFLKLMKEGIDKGIVLKDFESIDSVINLFPDKYKEAIKISFQCTDLETQYNLLNDIDKESIKNQIIDKFDMSSLEALNNRRFIESPINIPGLL